MSLFGNTIGAQMILPDDENYRKDELDDEVYENIDILLTKSSKPC